MNLRLGLLSRQKLGTSIAAGATLIALGVGGFTIASAASNNGG